MDDTPAPSAPRARIRRVAFCDGDDVVLDGTYAAEEQGRAAALRHAETCAGPLTVVPREAQSP